MQFSLTPFEELRPGIWRAVAQPAGVNIGLIAGSTGALVVDTGSSPAQGAEIRAAADWRVGSSRSIASGVTRNDGPETVRAATTCPSRSRIGADTAQRPTSCSSVVTA